MGDSNHQVILNTSMEVWLVLGLAINNTLWVSDPAFATILEWTQEPCVRVWVGVFGNGDPWGY